MKAACVVGYPARQSRSPKLHGYWIKRYGIDGDYRVEEIPPEQFQAFITDLAGHGYVGANITMPHKDAAFALSQPDARAQSVGAANTLWLDGAALRSTNTDVEGFLGALDATEPGWHQRNDNAVVLGAGGAGRAVVCGLIERGIKIIHVVNRSADKAQAMRKRFGNAVQPASWSQLPQLLAGTRLLANSTSLGMQGKDPLEIDLAPMPVGSVVFDCVYVPLKTRLLAAAEARGFKAVDGLDMLLYQAVRGFELWFGVRPEVTRELRELLAADIPKS